jgi:hypothetical protein
MEGATWADLSGGRPAEAVIRRLAAPRAEAPAPINKEAEMSRPVTAFQILAKDPDRAAQFYSRLFGWAVRADNALGYRRLTTGAGRGIDGGIWPAPPEGRSGVQLFVEVDDLAAAIEQACSLGGGVIIPPQKLPDGDEMAVIVDPEGVSLGLVRAKKA